MQTNNRVKPNFNFSLGHVKIIFWVMKIEIKFFSATQQKPRSASEERGRQRVRRSNVPNKTVVHDESGMSELLSEDSGNSSLNTFTMRSSGNTGEGEGGHNYWG